MDKFETDILKNVAKGKSDLTDNTLLGNVLAIGSYLVSGKLMPEEVVENRHGVYALTIATTKGPSVKTLRQGDKVTVGREVDNDGWRIEDPWMSRYHFTILIDDDGFAYLETFNTKNKTFINDNAVSGISALKRGDVIRAGNTSFILF